MKIGIVLGSVRDNRNGKQVGIGLWITLNQEMMKV